MAQKTISELKKLAGKPYTDFSVRVKVVKVGHSANFTTTSGEEMTILNFSVADETGCMLATLNDTKRVKSIAEGKFLHLRNFVLKNNKIFLTKSSKIMASASKDIPETICQSAVYLITPPSPKKKVSQIRSMPTKSVVTVTGKIVKDECVRTVKVGGPAGVDTPIHTIRIENDGDEINVSLWREMAKVPLTVGEYVEVTQCVTSEWQGQTQLNSTRNTSIMKVDIPEQTIFGNVEGVTVDDGKVEMALQTPDGYQDVCIEEEMLCSALKITATSAESLEESLTELIPFKITVRTKGNQVVEVTIKDEDNVRFE